MKMYIIVACFIGFDIITGVIKAIYNEGLNSTILRKGLFHKLSEILAVAGAWLFEYGITYINLGFDVPLVETVVAYICVMEIISILENISEMNPKLKKFFKPFLEKLKEKEKDNDE